MAFDYNDLIMLNRNENYKRIQIRPTITYYQSKSIDINAKLYDYYYSPQDPEWNLYDTNSSKSSNGEAYYQFRIQHKTSTSKRRCNHLKKRYKHNKKDKYHNFIQYWKEMRMVKKYQIKMQKKKKFVVMKKQRDCEK